MGLTPAELRAEFFRRRDSGEPMPATTPQHHAGDGSWHHAPPPPAPAVPIDRDADHAAQLVEIMRAAGGILGGWTLRAADPNSHNKNWCYLDRPDGASICGAVDRWGVGPGRVEFTGGWPKSEIFDRATYSPYHSEKSNYSSITVALSRSAEAIAGEIERRFLPGYLDEYAKRCEMRDEGDARARKQDAITRRLAAVIGASRCHRYHHSSQNAAADYFSGHDTAASGLRGCEIHLDEDVVMELQTDEATAAGILRLLMGGDDEEERL